MNLCSKTLNLAVGGDAPTHYWKMDSKNGSGFFPDSILSRDLRDHYSKWSVNPSGLISSCGQQDDTDNVGGTVLQVDDPHFVMTTLSVGITWRLWYKQTVVNVLPKTAIVLVDFTFVPPPSHLGIGDFSLFSDATNWIARFANDAAHDVFVPQPDDTNWHRLMVTLDMVDPMNVIAGIEIDNGARVTSSGVDLSGLYGDDFIYVGTIGEYSLPFPPVYQPILFDEIAYWRNKVLTPAESLADWNGGAGKSYP
jgi:hypothetical protein